MGRVVWPSKMKSPLEYEGAFFVSGDQNQDRD